MIGPGCAVRAYPKDEKLYLAVVGKDDGFKVACSVYRTRDAPPTTTTTTTLAICPTKLGVVRLTDTPSDLIRDVWVYVTADKAWSHVASLPAWDGPAPLVLLKSGQVAVGAGSTIYMMEPCKDQRPKLVRLPPGMTVLGLLSGDVYPGVILPDGSVLTLSRLDVWSHHKVRLLNPSSRTGVVENDLDTTVIRTVGVDNQDRIHFQSVPM